MATVEVESVSETTLAEEDTPEVVTTATQEVEVAVTEPEAVVEAHAPIVVQEPAPEAPQEEKESANATEETAVDAVQIAQEMDAVEEAFAEADIDSQVNDSDDK